MQEVIDKLKQKILDYLDNPHLDSQSIRNLASAALDLDVLVQAQMERPVK